MCQYECHTSEAVLSVLVNTCLVEGFFTVSNVASKMVIVETGFSIKLKVKDETLSSTSVRPAGFYCCKNMADSDI